MQGSNWVQVVMYQMHRQVLVVDLDPEKQRTPAPSL